MVSTREIRRDEEGYELDEKGYRVEEGEVGINKRTGKRKKAKPYKLTQAKVDKICKLIMEGNFIKDAVESVGVKYNTYLNIKKNAKKEIEPYYTWNEQINVAKAKAVTDKVGILHKEMENGNVGVIQWWLSRVHPNHWERTERIKAQVDNTQKIEIVRFSDKNKENNEE